ncbi:hypothetical protein BDV06DRAFT_229424 [Aspergillus oleicola]
MPAKQGNSYLPETKAAWEGHVKKLGIWPASVHTAKTLTRASAIEEEEFYRLHVLRNDALYTIRTCEQQFNDTPISLKSPDDPELRSTIYPATKDEQIVNTALLNFLTALIIHSKLSVQWSLHRVPLHADFKTASYEARTDGYLESIEESEEDKKIRALVEVKAVLRDKKWSQISNMDSLAILKAEAASMPRSHLDNPASENATIAIGYLNKIVFGAFIGSNMEETKDKNNSILESFLTKVRRGELNKSGAMMQVCDALGAVQEALATWNTTKCASGYSRTSTSSISVSEAKEDNEGVLNPSSKRTSVHGDAHRRSHGKSLLFEKPHRRATCSATRASDGESCSELATRCGISPADFTKYNPSSTLCSAGHANAEIKKWLQGNNQNITTYFNKVSQSTISYSANKTWVAYTDDNERNKRITEWWYNRTVLGTSLWAIDLTEFVAELPDGTVLP